MFEVNDSPLYGFIYLESKEEKVASSFIYKSNFRTIPRKSDHPIILHLVKIWYKGHRDLGLKTGLSPKIPLRQNKLISLKWTMITVFILCSIQNAFNLHKQDTANLHTIWLLLCDVSWKVRLLSINNITVSRKVPKWFCYSFFFFFFKEVPLFMSVMVACLAANCYIIFYVASFWLHLFACWCWVCIVLW